MDKRMDGECEKKAFLLYIHSWISRAIFDKPIGRKPAESEDSVGKKSYMQHARGLLLELRKCEIYPMLSGYREMRSWYGGKSAYLLHGNPVCEVSPRLFVDISRTAKAWGLNDEGHRLRVAGNEEGFRQLTRRFGRYKKMRTWALNDIRSHRENDKLPGKYVDWKEAHAMVMSMRGGNRI